MNLRQGNMTVQEYGLKFDELSRYDPRMVAYYKAQMNKFLYGVSDLVKTEFEMLCYWWAELLNTNLVDV